MNAARIAITQFEQTNQALATELQLQKKDVNSPPRPAFGLENALTRQFAT
jgi:hypothetical protein